MTNKQEKILNKMRYKNGSGKRIQQVKYNSKDEFYTSLSDIHQELDHYGNHFKGKHIICPCDCDILKNKPVYKIVIDFSDVPKKEYFSQTGLRYSIEKIIFYTLENGKYHTETLYGEQCRDFIFSSVQCNFVKSLTEIGEDFGVKSITASGYDTKKEEGIKFSQVKYSKYDIVITNPPFSQYRNFMDVILPIVRGRKNTNRPLDFILMSSFLDRVNPCVGLGLMNKEYYLGFNRHKSLKFLEPTKENGFKSKTVAVDWITTFYDAQSYYDSTEKKTGVKYEDYKDDFKFLDTVTMKDGTHPLIIQNKAIIPDNYMGWMQGSVGILTDLNYNDFDWYMTNAKKYYHKEHPELNPFAHKVTDIMLNFHGIVFKRKTAV